MDWLRYVGLSVLFLVLTGAVSAAAGTGTYETNMYADAASEEDFELSGSYETMFVGQRIDILFTYRVVFRNPYYNTTEMNAFTAELRNGSGHVLTSTDLQPLAMRGADNTTALQGGKLSTLTAPADIDHVRYSINHTMTDGEDAFTRTVTGGFRVDVPERDAYVRGVGTNATTVRRGDHIYLNGTTQSIDTMTVDGQEMPVATDGAFGGWIRIPTDLATGQHNLTVDLETDEGTYRRGLNVTVLNRPPTLSFSTPGSVRVGTNITLPVAASDDIRVVGITATFRGQEYPASNGTLRLPTAALSPGTYTVTVTATDTAGAVTATNTSFVVTTEPQSTGQNGTAEPNQTDDSGQADDDTASGPVDLVSQVRSFFENLLFGR
jgi:PKD repeat protein